MSSKKAGRWLGRMFFTLFVTLALSQGQALGVGEVLLVGGSGFASLGEAIEAATDGDSIQLEAGSYTLAQISLTKSLRFSPVEGACVTLCPAVDTGAGGNRNWVYVEAGRTVEMNGLDFDGAGRKIERAIYADGTLILQDCSFQNVLYDDNKGRAVTLHGEGSRVSSTSFANIGELGIYVDNAGQCLLENNHYTGKGSGNKIDYGFKIGGGCEIVVRGNHISHCQGILSALQRSAGIWILDNCYQPIIASIEGGNEIEENLVGICVETKTTPGHQISIHNNQIVQNSNNAIENSMPNLDATANYWGGQAPPTNGANTVSATVEIFPWALDTEDADGDGCFDHLAKPLQLSWAEGGSEARSYNLQKIHASETLDLSILAQTIDRAPDQDNVVFTLQWDREGGLQPSDIEIDSQPLQENHYQTLPTTITATPLPITFSIHFTRSGSYTLQIESG